MRETAISDIRYSLKRIGVRLARRIGPATAPIPINDPEAWSDDPSLNSQGEVRPVRNPKANIFRVSAENCDERRTTARRLLDSAFPLTTVDIERFIESK